ncbi:MAG: FAD-dependent oxidoreductase [Proteobacteria bacterium]|nr:FAD-dependent oxidoreductase [Pseudomonadota bacterium]
MKRLENLPTLRIDSSHPISFNYKGKKMQGVKGDTLATALFSNGIRIFSRSLKLHRPRGLYSLDGESGNTLMEVNGIPNLNTENMGLKEGMNVEEQNVKGSANHDLFGFLDRFDKMMPAGFYYRSMHKPAKIWPLAMNVIKKAAGWGKISPDFRKSGRYEDLFPNTDVCVIGGGPAGMTAALSAAKKGLRVILLEARPQLGGFFDYRKRAFNSGKSLFERALELAQQVKDQENIRVFKHTSMIGAYNNNLITAFQVGGKNDYFKERYIEIRAQSVVVATGCIERPLIFENNEKPGVMQVACAHRLAHTYGILPGQRAVFSVGHNLGLEAAIDLYDLGLDVACVADCRETGHDPELIDQLESRKIRLLKGWIALEAQGKKMLNSVTIGTLDRSIKSVIKCDLLVASAGHTPISGPLSINQAKLKYDAQTNFFLPTDIPAKTHAAGRLFGFEWPESIEASGKLAGLKAAADCDVSCVTEIKKVQKSLTNLPGPEEGNKTIMAPVEGRKSFICFDEDVAIKNIKQALNDGFDVPELIKRYTAAGLGPGQAGIPGHNLPLFVADFQGKSPDSINPTNQRAPLVPTSLATYVGAHNDMAKRTPINDLQIKDGGIFRRIGIWERARYFSEDLECKEEILNVRNNVGMLDGSPLGKFRIHGPDALKALQRVYISNIEKLKPGRIKYSAMCNEDGCVIDDGVITKLAENDYYFTTSTGRAGNTVEWIRYHTRYDNWNYHLVNLTDAMGVLNLSGPNSRKVLEKVTDSDVSNENFSFSAVIEIKIKNQIPVRAMRLGFVGELSYELHVASSFLPALWKIIEEAGQEFKISNFGVEAQNVLRMEKCHLILGQESEQRTNLLDVGMGFLWARKMSAENKVGAVALRQASEDKTRLKLVGIKMDDPNRPAKDGSIIVDKKIRGYVCTMRKSLTLKESVGMALVDEEISGVGTHLQIYEDECEGNTISASVIKMPFYDPDGRRMKI